MRETASSLISSIETSSPFDAKAKAKGMPTCPHPPTIAIFVFFFILLFAKLKFMLQL
jgi:hypothetical protein